MISEDGRSALEGSRAGIIGGSDWAQGLRQEIARVAPFSSSVLVVGPSGSGKELVARALHSQSSRSGELFVPVDCASVTGDLLASQLFGHLEGAFTSANYAALGSFRAADGGTIFLDEIGELELGLQAKLLRVIQERVVVPVGSHEGVPVDVRIIAATNRDLKQEVAAGRFREDLYFRLNVVTIRTVPLADRREDIGTLARAFLQQMAADGLPQKTLSPGALEALEYFDWPGNVRQLKNVLEQAVIASDAELIALPLINGLLGEAGMPSETHQDLLPEMGVEPQESTANLLPASLPSVQRDADWTTLAALEREHIVYTLEHTYYNQSAAARLLGITRQTLIRKIKKHQIVIPALKGHSTSER